MFFVCVKELAGGSTGGVGSDHQNLILNQCVVSKTSTIGLVRKKNIARLTSMEGVHLLNVDFECCQVWSVVLGPHPAGKCRVWKKHGETTS